MIQGKKDLIEGVGEASLRYSKSPDFGIWHLEKKSIANFSLTLGLTR